MKAVLFCMLFMLECRAGVIFRRYAVTKVKCDLVEKPEGVTYVLGDCGKAISKESKVAAWLAAAEGRSLSREMQGCPNTDAFDRTANLLELINTKPKPGPRQAADIPDSFLNQCNEASLESLVDHAFVSRS